MFLGVILKNGKTIYYFLQYARVSHACYFVKYQNNFIR